jgi:hypothetical protein
MLRKLRIWLRERFPNLWFKYYLRGNEFHKSLGFESEKYYKMDEVKKKAYADDLMRRRELAHKLDIKRNQS